MFKTFIIGLFLGAAALGAAIWFVPPIDQERERSIIGVTPNGGNSEVFYANIPTDRILIGAPGQEVPLPAGLEWPDDELFAGSQIELFKIRNANDAVVGVASRLSAGNADKSIIEWALHLPARGSVYVLIQPEAAVQGHRTGILRAGTREFTDLTGDASEHWIANTSDDIDAPAGRIELRTSFVSLQAAETGEAL